MRTLAIICMGLAATACDPEPLQRDPNSLGGQDDTADPSGGMMNSGGLSAAGGMSAGGMSDAGGMSGGGASGSGGMNGTGGMGGEGGSGGMSPVATLICLEGYQCLDMCSDGGAFSADCWQSCGGQVSVGREREYFRDLEQCYTGSTCTELTRSNGRNDCLIEDCSDAFRNCIGDQAGAGGEGNAGGMGDDPTDPEMGGMNGTGGMVAMGGMNGAGGMSAPGGGMAADGGVNGDPNDAILTCSEGYTCVSTCLNDADGGGTLDACLPDCERQITAGAERDNFVALTTCAERNCAAVPLREIPRCIQRECEVHWTQCGLD